jgi:hypothetical protein
MYACVFMCARVRMLCCVRACVRARVRVHVRVRVDARNRTKQQASEHTQTSSLIGALSEPLSSEIGIGALGLALNALRAKACQQYHRLPSTRSK